MSAEAIEAIKTRAVEEVLGKYLDSNAEVSQKLAMRHLLEDLVDAIMKGERNIFLGNSMDNKGNGYYPRDLTTGSWRLQVNVPRDRKGDFRPHVLPDPYKRVDDSYIDLLMSLVIILPKSTSLI